MRSAPAPSRARAISRWSCPTPRRRWRSVPAALAVRGNAYLRLKRADEALADFDKVLAARPKHAPSLHGRGLARRQKGDLAGGDADIAAAKAIDPGVAELFAGATP